VPSGWSRVPRMRSSPISVIPLVAKAAPERTLSAGPASGASRQNTMPELQPDASLPGHTFTVEAYRSRRWPPRMLF
jgi:hypothetical protein